VRAKFGRLLCHLGRHDREYLIGHNDLVVAWCPRCQNPKAADVFDAKRLPGTRVPTPPTEEDPHRDRPVADALDHDALSAAVGMLAAINKSDVPGFTVLAKHSEPKPLTFALCFLVIDALAERGTDLGAYTDDLFERLARRRQ
jgi:hypothetical protein